jgi:hypothetical protein
VLLFLWKRHTLHEHRSREIYTVGEVVSHIVVIPVNSECHCSSLSSHDINEQRGMIQHIDIVGFGNPKKSISDPTVI